MTDRNELLRLAELAERSGDQQTALAALRQVEALDSEGMAAPGVLGTVAGEIGGTLETVGAIASAGASEVVGGLAGFGTSLLTGDPSKGADVVRWIQSTAYTPKTAEGQRNLRKFGELLQPLADGLSWLSQKSGDLGYDIAGPVGGGIAAALPETALEVLGATAGAKAATKATNRAATKAEQAAQQALSDAEKLKAGSEAVEDVVKSFKSGNVETIATAVNADPKFFDAMDELGINADPAVYQYAGSTQARDIAGSIAAQIGSKQGDIGDKFVDAVSERARGLIEEFGGTRDTATLSERYRANVLESVEEIKVNENYLFESVASLIDPASVVDNPRRVRALLQEKARRLGGAGKLDPQMRKIWRNVVDESPTYGMLEELRRDIYEGQKGRGKFADLNSKNKAELYEAFRRDINQAAKEVGGWDAISTLKEANKLTGQRKTIESINTKLLGDDLQKSITNIARSKLTGMARNSELPQFNEFINSIDERFRGEVVASALGEWMTGKGAGTVGFSPTQFGKNLELIYQQPALRSAILKHLPEGSGKKLDALKTIVDGINKGNSTKIKNGRTLALLDEEGLIAKMSKEAGARAVDAILTPSRALGIHGLLQNRTPRSVKAGELISTPAFSKMIAKAVSEGVVEGKAISRKLRTAEKELQKSATYKAWAETLDKTEAATIASYGLINYLLEERKDDGLQTDQ